MSGCRIGCVLVLIAVASSGCSKPEAATSKSSASATSTSATSTVAATSAYDKGPRAAEGPRDEHQAKQGEQLFKDKGCSACHAFGKRVTGPDLAGVSQRRTARWIEQQILHPDVMTKTDPISRGLFATFALQMPNQGLTEAEARAVIEYFKHRDHEAAEQD